MSRPAHSPTAIESIERSVFSGARGSEQGQRRHNDGELSQQNAIAFDAKISAHATTSRRFGFSDLGYVELGCADCIDHFLHDVPQPKVREHHFAIYLCEQVKPSKIRHCSASAQFASNARQCS